MNIAIFANFGLGILNFREELITELLSNGHKVTIIYPFDEYKDKFIGLGCDIINVTLNRRGMNPFQDIVYINQVREIFKKNKFDLILTYTIKPNIYVGIMARIHKINYITNITGLGTTFNNHGLMRKLVIKLYKTALKDAKKVFFQNISNLGTFLSNNIITDNYSLLPGSGVNTSKFPVLGYPENSTINFLFIGRLMREKGIYELISAFEKLKDKEITLNIIGFAENDESDYIHSKTCQAEYNINYLGYQTNISDYIGMNDVIINPSYHEGMSNVLLEAGSSGRPLLASNISGCKEIIVENETGYLFEAKSVSSIIESIQLMKNKSQDERRQMGLKSHEYIKEKFDRKIIIKEYLKTIEEIKNDEQS